MKKLILALAPIAVAGAFGMGCGAVSNGAGTPTPVSSDTPTPTPTGTSQTVTISTINHGTITSGSPVSLAGLVVTAVNSGSGDFYAQDAGGGAYTGILFFDKNHHTPVGLAVGDEVSVTGTFSPYSGPASSTWPIAENEIIPDTVTQTNTGLTPVATEVAAADLFNDLKMTTTTSGIPADLSWMGTFIHVTGVQCTDVALGYGEWGVGDTASHKLHVDKSLFDSFEPRFVTESITSLTGVVAYNFSNYHINPRSAADITTTGTNTPMTFASINALLTSTTVNPGQLVTLTGTVYVNGVSPYTNSSGSSSKSFWAQDSLTGAVSSGMYFYDWNYKNPAAAAGKQTTSISGKYIVKGTTFKIHSIQIGYDDLTPVVPTFSGTNTLTAMTVPLTTLQASTTSVGPYEGLLVKIADASMKTVTAVNTYNDYQVGTATTSAMWVSPAMVNTAPTFGDLNHAIASAQGPVFFAHGNDYLVPQNAGDVN